MDCTEAHEQMSAENGRADELQDHLRACRACALLRVEQREALSHDAGESQARETERLFGQLQERLSAERGITAWLRSRPTGVRLGLAGVVALGVPLAFAAVQPRLDLAVYPRARLMALSLALLGLITVALAIKLRPIHRPPLSSWLPLCIAAFALGMMAIDAILPVAHMLHPASSGGTGADWLVENGGCLAAGVATGLPALMWAAALDRSANGWLDHSLLGAVVAGLAGYLALHLHCPIVAPAHLLAGHLSVLLVFLGARAVVPAAWRPMTT